MIRFKTILLTLFLALAVNVSAQEKQVAWAQNLGGSDKDEAMCIEPTKDGGLIVAGYSYSNDGLLSANNGWQDGWLVKTNNEGYIEWQKNIGGNGADVIEEVVEVADGYIICGWSSSADNQFIQSKGLEDGFVAKVNTSGELLWKKSFGGKLMDKLFDLEVLDNGNIVAVGYLMSPEVTLNNSTHQGLLDIWVVKLTSSGQLLWQKCFGGSDDDFAYNIQKTDNNNLIIAGSSDSMDGLVGSTAGEWDCWVIKIDAEGQLLWSQKIGYEANEIVNDLVKYNNAYYVIGASNSSSRIDAHGNYDAWIVQLDPSGNIINDYSYGSAEQDLVNSATATPDGIFISGESASNDANDGWLIQIDGNGSILQSQYIGGSDYDILNDISFKDGALYLTGSSHSSDGDMSQNFGSGDALLAKLGTEKTENTSSIQVFPNPSSDQITIVLNKIGIEQVTIYNAMGQVITSIPANNFFQEQLDISSWANGIYTIETLSNNELIRTQFVKI
ncbi:T9SS type A sorting domain-containing protein [Parvicella tangerina]|uniref:Secretion system C-terminal sorting domain-containing protein n=1 Tax=Parvicella tangerina TaxID=2829795 RepID=A0A916JNH6_9FLAO|nr:T9SS type A sorting domain-containing protein [Parvicella tangerina]CAG5083839.1 hypothetical protein CRYO30217_02306 [Parvicella tangerina]